MSAGFTAPSATSGYDDAQPRMGFFTDTSVCIGCKACEVACKEWNDIPATLFEFSGKSYDNTVGLGADVWRHVAFIEQRVPRIQEAALSGVFTEERPGEGGEGGLADFRWLMSSDVCKHCTTASCLDVCPTGALFKTEFATVVVQEDICNGCGYCIPACPYGVIDQRKDDGRAWKCTLCYDRLKGDLEPACAKACPTDSINFGPLEAMERMAAERLDTVMAAHVPGAQLYGDGPSGGMDGVGSLFLLLDQPEVYGLPPDPVAVTKHVGQLWRAAAVAGAALVGAAVASFAGVRR